MEAILILLVTVAVISLIANHRRNTQDAIWEQEANEDEVAVDDDGNPINWDTGDNVQFDVEFEDDTVELRFIDLMADPDTKEELDEDEDHIGPNPAQ